MVGVNCSLSCRMRVTTASRRAAATQANVKLSGELEDARRGNAVAAFWRMVITFGSLGSVKLF